MLAVVGLHSHNRRRVVPAVLQPAPTERDNLSPTDRQEFDRLLHEPAEYLDNDRFHRPGAQKQLFEPQPFDSGQANLPAGVARVDVRTRKQRLRRSEGVLFLRYNYARMRVARLLDRYSGERMPPVVIRDLLAWNRRAMASRDQIVECNMGLVLAMLQTCWYRHVDQDDLISEGNLTLLRCVNQFDCSLGYRFSTFAGNAIRRSLKYVAEKTVRHQLHFGVSLDPGMEPVDDRPAPYEEAESNAYADLLRILKGEQAFLTPAEQSVIQTRFLRAQEVGPEARTFRNIGNTMGVSKERVRQLQGQALRKLRLVLSGRLSA